MTLVSKDKKARGAANRFILLESAGNPVAVENVKLPLLKKAFEGALK